MSETDTFEAAQAVDGAMPARLQDSLGELIDGVAEFDRIISRVQAWRAELIDRARRWSETTVLVGELERGDAGGPLWSAKTLARRVLVTELAAALRLPERSAENLVAESELLVHEFPATLHALREGELGYRHATTIIDHALSLPDEARDGFEAAVLPAAKQLTVAKLDRKARVQRERSHPESIVVRKEKSAADREVRFEPARDGMAWLSQYQPAEVAQAEYNRITAIARSLQGPEESRTLAQLRADIAADLLLEGVTEAGLGRSIRPTLMVTIPVLTLLGRDDEPASLEGYGPIDPETARRLAAHAPSFIRILTHPETGTVLSVGRQSYAIPADLRRWIQLQDGTCRFPGCNRVAKDCEGDHQRPWQDGGETSSENLTDLCPGHHDLKHQTRWSYERARDGTVDWTAPSGHRYTTEPAVRMALKFS